VPKLRTYTDETALGFINDELDALYTAAEAVPDINDLGDVVITTPADNELLAYDSGSGDWINQTPTEAGLDAIYEPLGTTHAVDDLSDVVITSVGDDDILAYDTGTSKYINQTAAEAGLATDDHTHTLLADRTIVSLTSSSATRSAGVVDIVGGANADVGMLEFPDAATNNAVWQFKRPSDWDSGQIRVTWWWTNSGAAVIGNHYFAQRLTGWADGEDIGTPNGNTLISGAATVTGLNNAGKIASHNQDDSGVVTLSNEDFFSYRIQRQGAHGNDTSSQPWHLILITFELIAI
jgi:hypothetical protein